MSIWLPTGFSWRELWESRNLSGVNWRSSIPDGKLLTMTNCIAGAERRSTSAGIQFVAGVTTSNVEFVDPYDAVNDWWCSFRFKLDSDFSSASATNQFLLGKYDDVTNYITVNLRAADGKLVLAHDEGGGAISAVSDEVSWEAGVWYNVIVWISNTDTEHGILIDDGDEVITADGTAISLTADICIGAADNGVSVDGFTGVISDVFMGNDVLTDAEKTDLYNGIPPADTVNAFKFNEGGGSVAHDDGSGADDGTLDTSCTWAWDEVQQPVASFAGIDQYAISGANLDISGDLSIVWVGKMKTTCDTPATYTDILRVKTATPHQIELYNTTGANITLDVYDGSSNGIIDTNLPSIDDYRIYVITNIAGGIEALYRNGIIVGTITGADALEALPATLALGATTGGANEDVNEPIIVGIIEGALNAEQARAVTKHISDRLGLGVI